MTLWRPQARKARQSSPRPASRLKGGFTLLEVLIAVTILGVAITSLLGLHAGNLRLATEVEDLTRASMLASVVMDATRTREFPELGVQRGKFTEERDQADDTESFFGGVDSTRYEWRREVLPSDFAVETVYFIKVSVYNRGDQDRPLAELWAARRKDDL